MSRWILLLILCSPFSAYAQMVRGTATDANNGAPVKAVDISLFSAEGQPLGRTISNETGQFEIVLPKGKTVYLQASRIGYETVRSKEITATTKELLQLSIRMSEVGIPLQPVEVVTRRQVDARLQPFLDRASMYKRVGIGHLWTRSELEQRHPTLVTHVIDYWVPRRTDINCAGVSVFLDDVPIDTTDIDLMVAPEQLEGVEIYTDLEVPPDLLMHALSAATAPVDVTEEGSVQLVPPCKTVMLWRKPYRELNQIKRPHVSIWRRLVAGSVVGAILLLEQIIW